MVTQK